jgi:hypothetical protein
LIATRKRRKRDVEIRNVARRSSPLHRLGTRGVGAGRKFRTGILRSVLFERGLQQRRTANTGGKDDRAKRHNRNAGCSTRSGSRRAKAEASRESCGGGTSQAAMIAVPPDLKAEILPSGHCCGEWRLASAHP